MHLPQSSITDAVGLAVGRQIGTMTFLPESVIVREGDEGDCAYYIESGQVRVSKLVDGVATDIATLGPGELIGEMAPIDGDVRSATVIATTQVDLVPIDRTHLESLVAKADPLLNVLIRALLNRLRSMQAQIQSAPQPDRVAPKAANDSIHQDAIKAASDQLKLERGLNDALKRREFVLYLQPIVDLVERDIVGFESLIRWVRPDIGMVSPNDFVKTAERTGHIVPIGLWVIEQAGFLQQRLRNVLRGGAGKDRPLFLTVNVSARQLLDPADIQSMRNAISASGADPSNLKLEITENAFIENETTTLAALQEFRDMGIKIAIDDFGTGFSSLSYLHRFPVDVLKIDRSFVSSMLSSKQSLELTRNIVSLASRMQMEAIAEGIEHEQEIQTLTDMGCESGQGYYFAKPLTLTEAEMALERGGKL